MNRTTLDSYWARYGKEPIASTYFTKAIKRLPPIGPDGPWVCGGSVRRLVMGLPQDSDYDFFFRDEAQFQDFCTGLSGMGAKQTASSEFNISYRLSEVDLPVLKIQAIRVAFYPTLEATLDSFDFSLCQLGYDGTDLVTGQWTLFDLASNRLVPGKIRYGVSSIRRVIKYTKQGYTICGGGLASMLEQIADDRAIINAKVEYID